MTGVQTCALPILLEVVGAAHAVGGFANLLHGGHQQADKHRDNGDDNQKLNQGECWPAKR